MKPRWKRLSEKPGTLNEDVRRFSRKGGQFIRPSLYMCLLKLLIKDGKNTGKRHPLHERAGPRSHGARPRRGRGAAGTNPERRRQLRAPAVGLGALVASPFQKANIFSRARRRYQNSNLGTLERRVILTDHMIRRAVFMFCLPLAGVAYTVSSSGTPIPVSCLGK